MYRTQIRSVSRRQFSSNLIKLNVKGKLPGETVVLDAPKKLSHPVRKFFVRIGLLTSVIYVGGVTLLMKNDTIYDNFVDYFPLGEELIDFAENKILNYNMKSAAKDSELPSFNSKIEKTIPITKSGVLSSTVSEDELKKLEAVKEEVKANIAESKASNATIETILPLIKFKSGDDLLNKAIDSFNDVIRSINHRTPVHTAHINTVSESIKSLDAKLSAISADYTRSLSDLTDSKNENLNFVVEQKEVELTKNYIKQLDYEKELLEKKFNEIMIKEVESAKLTLFEQAQNKIDSIKVKQLQEFNKIISEKIDSERNGKLSQLDLIFDKIAKIEQVENGISKELSNYQYLKNLQIELSRISSILNDSSKPILLNDQFDKLTQLVKDINDTLLIESIDQLPKSGNLLTKQQLITRWKLLVPELKSASLLPPNAGILGHFTSKIVSKFLFSKEGFSEGNDIESIIARVNGFLERDELDLAVEQVTNLKGWSRRLADDWVKESRKRLEVEFLINVIEYESRLLA